MCFSFSNGFLLFLLQVSLLNSTNSLTTEDTIIPMSASNIDGSPTEDLNILVSFFGSNKNSYTPSPNSLSVFSLMPTIISSRTIALHNPLPLEMI